MKLSKKKRLELFRRNFDAEQFDGIKDSILKELSKTESLDGLMDQLRQIPQVTCVDTLDEHELQNEDFVPGYQGEDEDRCDFFVVICFALLDISKMNTDAKCIEICFYVIYNEIKQAGWIDTASLAIAYNPEDYTEVLCFFDVDTHRPITWHDDPD